jgi:hypothetical protein
MHKHRNNQSGFTHIIAPLVVVLLIALVGTYVLISSHADTPSLANSATPLTASAQSCAHPHGPFQVSGNHVLDSSGHVFTPYGITVYGLSESSWRTNMSSDDSQINATAAYWCANTVRIQVAPANMFSNLAVGSAYNKDFMAAVDAEVQLAFKDNLNVVLTAQTEHLGGQLAPTMQTEKYWDLMGTHYSGVNNIIFDLFNEPRLAVSVGGSAYNSAGIMASWNLWKNGGTYQGTQYLGMQQLADNLRQEDVHRTFWVEGPFYSSSLNLVSKYPINGYDIIYDLHHPAGAHDAASWDADFGNLAATRPVVIGEMSQYAAGNCWSNAATAIPQFLTYLQQKQIGLVLWALQPGVLVQNSALNVPTNVTSSYHCSPTLDQGSGRVFADFFRANNITN